MFPLSWYDALWHLSAMQSPIILLTKQDEFSVQAASIARCVLGDVEHLSGKVGDAMPERLNQGAEFLISFLSPWIIPQSVLSRCSTAINFHPASVEYPGTGCYNFALYEGATTYGATCHHMLAKVDTGPIILERRFPVFQADSVASLKLRTMVTMVSMFHDIACGIAQGQKLPAADVHWTRRAFTWREMEDLKELRPSMSENEISRRVRATDFPGYPGPYMVGEHREERPKARASVRA